MTLYRGNIDPSLTLKSEAELKHVWIKFGKQRLDKKHKRYVTDYRVQAFDPACLAEEKRNLAKFGFDFQTAAQADTMETLHDPSLIKTEDDIKALIIE
jgi:hypothetical protein